MNTPAQKPERSLATPLIVLSLGAVQVGIIGALLLIDSPIRDLALRATETWIGRAIIAFVGLACIIVVMIGLLSWLERRQANAPPTPPES